MTALATVIGCGENRAPSSQAPAPDATPSAGASRRITFLVASSALEAIEEVVRRFEAETGVSVEISAGASNALAQQILSGAPADLFLSANEKWAEAIASAAEERRPLLGNRLVIIVPKGNPAGIQRLSDLANASVQRLALAGENVPAGQYADQALRAWKLDGSLQQSGKVVRGTDVRVTMGYVERGEAEAGIVYATDAAASSKVEIAVRLPVDLHQPILYPLALLKRENPSQRARELFEFLQSAEAAAQFRQRGFEPLAAVRSASETKASPHADRP